MGEEQKIEITENGQYKNIGLRSNLKKGIKGIEDGNYIIVTKKFAEGKETRSMFEGVKGYNILVEYEGQDVSFFLNNKFRADGTQWFDEYDRFNACGGIGDKVKITLRKEPFVNQKTGIEMIKQVLEFEKVE